MARTPEGAQLTEAHRRLQLRVAASVTRDLLTLWALVDVANLRSTIGPFTRAGQALVLRGNRSSASAAARYYSAFRLAEGVRGAVAVTTSNAPDAALVASQLRGGGLAGILSARRAGASLEEAQRRGFVRLAGSATGLVLGGGRETLMGAIESDREAQGWQRVTDGDPCAFCAMIASRGIIFKSDDSAGFEAHGHCGCTAEPAFEGSSLNPTNERYRAAWNEATEGLKGTDALNAFRRSLST